MSWRRERRPEEGNQNHLILSGTSHTEFQRRSQTVCLYELYCKKSYLHLLQLTVFFNSLHTLSKLYTQIQELHTQNAKSLTSLVKWSTNTSQKQTFANTFPIILIPARFLCYTENCVLCFAKMFYEIENWVKGWE